MRRRSTTGQPCTYVVRITPRGFVPSARSLEEHGVIGGLTAALPRSCARMHTRRVQAPKDFPEEAINKSTGGYFDANEKLYGK